MSRIWVQGRGELPRGSLGRFQLPLKVGLGRAGDCAPLRDAGGSIVPLDASVDDAVVILTQVTLAAGPSGAVGRTRSRLLQVESLLGIHEARYTQRVVGNEVLV